MRFQRPQRLLSGLLILSLGLIFPLTAGACLWDYDTLRQERSRFPSALELITGKFPRHTQEFYAWRIKDRQQKITASGATPELLDDLAVAFDKLGDHAQAIATMEQAEQLFPGRYETAANLGTFYFHSQQLAAGIPHIERAIQMNPDAHFGREKYQQLLVKYLLSKQVDGQTKLPLSEINEYGEHAGKHGFRHWVLEGLEYKQHAAEITKATKGVLGMMRFGKSDSPILLEVLGDLLYGGEGDAANTQQLAARAYLQASDLTKDQPEVSKAYRLRAGAVLVMQTKGRGDLEMLTLAELEAGFQKELADAHGWYAELAADEKNWIATSHDPEAAYAAKYAADPVVVDSIAEPVRSDVRRIGWPLATVCGTGLLLAAFTLFRIWRKGDLARIAGSVES